MADLGKDVDSDSENDPDYVPGNGNDREDDSGSESSSSENGVTKRPRKKSRLSSKEPSSSTVPGESTTLPAEERTALWESFLSSTKMLEKQKEVKMIRIEKKYIFAGQEVTETKEVAEDSEEAIAFLASQSKPQLPPTPTPPPSVHQPPLSTLTSTPPPTTTVLPPARPPPPKRKLLSSTSKSTKPKKLTTLEKSKMDWSSHLASEAELREEVEEHRKGGDGYLDKVDFLGRVDERRLELEEGVKGRRKRAL